MTGELRNMNGSTRDAESLFSVVGVNIRIAVIDSVSTTLDKVSGPQM